MKNTGLKNRGIKKGEKNVHVQQMSTSSEDTTKGATNNDKTTDNNGDTLRPAKRRRRKLSTAEERIKRDLAPMMYGFGDVPRPATESVEVLYDMVQGFVTAVTQKGLDAEKQHLKGSARYQTVSLTHKPLVWSIRRDRRLHERIIALLASHKTIKASKKLIKDEDEIEEMRDDDDDDDDDDEDNGENE